MWSETKDNNGLADGQYLVVELHDLGMMITSSAVVDIYLSVDWFEVLYVVLCTGLQCCSNY